MLTHETSLADVEHGRSRIHPALVSRLRAAAIVNVQHLMRASETSIGFACPNETDRAAVRRWRGRLAQQLHHQGKKNPCQKSA